MTWEDDSRASKRAARAVFSSGCRGINLPPFLPLLAEFMSLIAEVSDPSASVIMSHVMAEVSTSASSSRCFFASAVRLRPVQQEVARTSINHGSGELIVRGPLYVMSETGFSISDGDNSVASRNRSDHCSPDDPCSIFTFRLRHDAPFNEGDHGRMREISRKTDVHPPQIPQSISTTMKLGGLDVKVLGELLQARRELLDKGLITQSEYDAMRQNLLSQSSPVLSRKKVANEQTKLKKGTISWLFDWYGNIFLALFKIALLLVLAKVTILLVVAILIAILR